MKSKKELEAKKKKILKAKRRVSFAKMIVEEIAEEESSFTSSKEEEVVSQTSELGKHTSSKPAQLVEAITQVPSPLA